MFLFTFKRHCKSSLEFGLLLVASAHQVFPLRQVKEKEGERDRERQRDLLTNEGCSPWAMGLCTRLSSFDLAYRVALWLKFVSNLSPGKNSQEKDFISVSAYSDSFQGFFGLTYPNEAYFCLPFPATRGPVLLLNVGSSLAWGWGFANNGLQAKSSPSLVFVNNPFLEFSLTYHLHIVHRSFPPRTATLSRSAKIVANKAGNIYYLSLYTGRDC